MRCPPFSGLALTLSWKKSAPQQAPSSGQQACAANGNIDMQGN